MVPKKDFSLSSEEYLALEKIVTQAFSQRRKVLRNNLSSFKNLLGMTEQELGQRAQEITVERYIEWAKAWAISHKNADQ
jgi:16S rRNA (adenine1518-N6/adenine1519-N6)-dimethyltransferase